MYNRISVCQDGHLLPQSDTLGRVGEHNATVLRFTFFEELNGKFVSDFQKYLVVLFEEGEKSYLIDSDNEFEIPLELTESPELLIRVDLKKDKDVIFKSEPKLFTLTDSDIVPPSVPKKHPLVGELEKLLTKNKENLVEAINEVLSSVGVSGKGIKSVYRGYFSEDDSGFGTGTLTDSLIIEYTDDTKSAIPLPGIFKQELTVEETENGIVIHSVDSTGAIDVFEIKNGAIGPPGPRGEKGNSGVYVGSGEMPEGYDIQIDPDGDEFRVPTKISELENDSGFVTEEKFKTQAENEEPTYGEELAGANGWTSDGWTGDFVNGFTNTSGNTNSLIFTMPEETAQNTYRIAFRCSKEIAPNALMVKCGGSELFDLYGQNAEPLTVGIVSVENGNVEFVPLGTFTGTITDISIKRVTGVIPTGHTITDSTGKTSFEIRTTKANQNNIFLGNNAGKNNVSGYGCVAVGKGALNANTSGFWNIGVGFNALRSNTVGSRNVVVGYTALGNNITGSRNIALGSFALNRNTTGNKNIAIGADSIDHNISGSENVGIGYSALYNNTTGNSNLAIGSQAIAANTTGMYNTAVGAEAMNGNTTGNYNVAVGAKTLSKNEGANYSVAIGYTALYGCKGGIGNTAIGMAAGKGTNNGVFRYGVFIGYNAGSKSNTGADFNICIGYNAGDNVTTGANNICIGKNARTPTETTSNYLNIGDLIVGSMASADKYAKINGGLQLSDIPTSDPAIAGRVWNDNGTLKVSVG